MKTKLEFVKWVCKEKSILRHAEEYRLCFEGTTFECVRYENPNTKEKYSIEEFLQLPQVAEWSKEYEALAANPQIEVESFDICGTEIVVGLNGDRECEIDAVDFLDFHCEINTAWSHDPKTRLVSMPQGAVHYDEHRDEYVSIPGRSAISTYTRFFEDQHDIKDMLKSYILSADVPINQVEEGADSMEEEANQFYYQTRF